VKGKEIMKYKYDFSKIQNNFRIPKIYFINQAKNHRQNFGVIKIIIMFETNIIFE